LFSPGTAGYCCQLLMLVLHDALSVLQNTRMPPHGLLVVQTAVPLGEDRILPGTEYEIPLVGAYIIPLTTVGSVYDAAPLLAENCGTVVANVGLW
jgi:hypothetical protein